MHGLDSRSQRGQGLLPIARRNNPVTASLKQPEQVPANRHIILCKENGFRSARSFGGTGQDRVSRDLRE